MDGKVDVAQAKADQRPVVLVVDDQEDTRESLSAYIAKNAPGAHVMTAASAAEALDLLPRVPATVIFSDLIMPDMDGVEFLQKARAICPGAHRYLLTAYPMEVDYKARKQGTVEGVLLKHAVREVLDALPDEMLPPGKRKR